MDKRKAQRTLAALLLALATHAADAAHDGPLDRSSLPGRLFYIGTTPATTPWDRRSVEQHLYVVPADASSSPRAIPGSESARHLVYYPSTKTVGFTLFNDTRPGSYAIDIRPGSQFAATPAIPDQVEALYLRNQSGRKVPTPREELFLSTQVVVSPDGLQVAGIARGGLCIAPNRGTQRVFLSTLPKVTERCVETPQGCEYFAPAWSPDDKEVAFVAPISSNRQACNLREIFVLDMNTWTVRQLTDVPGRKLHRQDIRVLVAEGADTDHWHSSAHPVWSPDGQWILFESAQRIARVRRDGTDLQIIAEGRSPAWSPDGAMIAFSAPRHDAPGAERARNNYGLPWHIFVSRPDGTGKMAVTDRDALLTIAEVVWTN